MGRWEPSEEEAPVAGHLTDRGGRGMGHMLNGKDSGHSGPSRA